MPETNVSEIVSTVTATTVLLGFAWNYFKDKRSLKRDDRKAGREDVAAQISAQQALAESRTQEVKILTETYESIIERLDKDRMEARADVEAMKAVLAKHEERINALEAERDSAKAELVIALSERDAAKAELLIITAEREALRLELTAARAEAAMLRTQASSKE